MKEQREVRQTQLDWAALGLLIGVIASISTSAAADWRALGPCGGEVKITAISPAYPELQACFAADNLYLSDDSGLSWRQTARSMFLDTDWNPRDYYLARATWNSRELWVFEKYPGRLFYSADDGETWRRRDPQDISALDSSTWSALGFAVDILTPGHCYLSMSRRNYEQDTYEYKLVMTLDRGQHWTEISLPPDASYFSLWAPPLTPPLLVIAKGVNIWTSSDDGASWASLPATPHQSWLTAVVAGPTFYTADDAHLFRLAPGAANWETIALPVQRWLVVYVSPNDDELVVSSATEGVFKSDDGGASWSRIFSEPYEIYSLSIQGDDFLIGSHNGVYSSTDGGAHFVNANEGIYALQVNDLAFDPFTPELLFAISDLFLWRSSDSGVSWSQMPNVPVIGDLRSLLIDPFIPGRMLLGSNGLLILSTDSGDTWRLDMENLWDKHNLRLAGFHPDSHAALLFTENIYGSNGDYDYWSRVMSRSAADTTWEEAVTDDRVFVQLSIEPENTPRWLLVRLGPYELDRLALSQSQDGGLTWTDIDTGPPSTSNGFEHGDVGGAFVRILASQQEVIFSAVKTYWYDYEHPLPAYQVYASDNLIRIDTASGARENLESYPANEVLLLDEQGDDYLLASVPVCRAGRQHLQATPLGSGSYEANRLRRDPLRPERILATRTHGSVYEFILDQEAPPPPPTNVVVRGHDFRLELTWELPTQAVGTKLYAGDDSGVYPLRDIIPDRQTNYTVDYNHPIANGYLYVRLSCYDDNGRESEFTAESRVWVGANSPRILMAGFLTTMAQKGNPTMVFAVWATDPQGVDDLDYISMESAKIPYLPWISDTDGDGVFIAELPTYFDYEAGTYDFQAVAIDKEGNPSPPWPALTTFQD